MDEKLLIGWKEIAAIFQVSDRKMKAYREELQTGGFIFYKNVGRPPQRRVCAFPSSLKRWIAFKSARGEML